MGPIHTPEPNVLVVRICQELPCSISSVLIYYALELDIRVKSNDHLNYTRAILVHFLASRYIIGLIHTPESKVMIVRICRELLCSISSVSIYYAPDSDIRMKIMTIWITWELLLFIFRASRYITGLTHTPEPKLWLFEFPESFLIQFFASRDIMRQNRTSDWKVMTIWISRELLLFIF